MRWFRQKDVLAEVRLGAESETVKRVMGETLGQELESLLSQFAAAKPDLGTYSFLAGQVNMCNKILKSLDLRISDAKEAREELMRNVS